MSSGSVLFSFAGLNLEISHSVTDEGLIIRSLIEVFAKYLKDLGLLDFQKKKKQNPISEKQNDDQLNR